MRKFILFVAVCAGLGTGSTAFAQRIDFSFGASTTTGPSATFDANGNTLTQSFARGTYLSFGGNLLFWHDLGLNAEVTWRATRSRYDFGLFGTAPYRPLFYDFNAVYSPKFNRISPELMAGIGAESLRIYSGQYTCYYTCTNYTTTNHFAGHFAGGLKLYVKGGLFVRPEAHVYLVRNNQEFNGSMIGRYGASIGYSFGGK